jgi:hypothetical protein
MHTSLEASPYRCIKLPGDVGCAKDEHAFAVFAYSVHLHEHFCFYAAGGFGLAFATRPAESVDFVYKNDAGFVFTGHVEELFHQSVVRC